MGRPTLEQLTGKSHLSYSAVDTFQSCPEKYNLSRVYKVDEEQSFWFIGGRAFHTATEWFDRGDLRSPVMLWADAWDEAFAEIDPLKPIRAGGRATKAYPNKEDASWWSQYGPEMVTSYARWRDASGWNILTEGDYTFIEWEFDLVLENPLKTDDASPNIIVKGAIDRVFVTRDGQVKVCDLKTGSREPAAATQLGVYRAALVQNAKIDIDLGMYYMARKGEATQDRALNRYTPKYIAYLYAQIEDSIRSQKFVPHVTSMCGTCAVASSCYAVGGTPPYKLPFMD